MARLQRLFLILVFACLFFAAVAFADEDSESEESSNNDGEVPSPSVTPPTTTISTTSDSEPMPVTTTTTTTLTDTSLTPSTTTRFSVPTISIKPTVIDPFFPKGSESCQKCRVYYPKLKECHQIANRTLPPHPASVQRPPLPVDNNGTIATLDSKHEYNFTTILPFLQCICPNHGLPAVRVCLTCFRVTSQMNFLHDIVVVDQNENAALEAYQEACIESENGQVVPAASKKGQSAAGTSAAAAAATLLTARWTLWPCTMVPGFVSTPLPVLASVLSLVVSAWWS